MTEPIRILGDSAFRFLEGLSDGSIYARRGYNTDFSDHFFNLINYAKDNFKYFLEDVLDDYLDMNVPSVLGIGRYQARFEISISLVQNYEFSPQYPWVSNDSLQESMRMPFDTMSISVTSRQFRPFRVELPMPDDGIFYTPRYLFEYINRIGAILIEHIRQNDDNYGRPSVMDWVREMGREEDRRYLDYAERIISSIRVEETPEQRQAWGEREKAKRIAAQKARELLLSNCTKKQQQDYLAHEWFVVRGKSGTKYRIRKASQINIDVLNRRNKVQYKLCTVAAEFGIPIEDQLLAQKTMIELNEKEFLEIAKRWSA